ncbi:MAG TPA: thioredoxin family protein [Acidimicrobiia bacterium]
MVSPIRPFPVPHQHRNRASEGRLTDSRPQRGGPVVSPRVPNEKAETQLMLKPTLVEVTAPWCGECHAMRPTIERVAGRYPDVAFRVIDASVDHEMVGSLGVKGTPTLIGCARGEEIFRFTGRRTSAELEAMFDAVSGARPIATVGRGDVLVRIGAGVALIVSGLLSGPVWVLVGLGSAVGLFGLLTVRNRSR